MKSKKVICIVWWIYIFLLFVFVVVKFKGSFEELGLRISAYAGEGAVNYNLIPFRSIGTQLEYITEWWALKNILGNIIPFMPFGFLLSMVYNKVDSLFRCLAAGILFVLFVELFQFLTKLGSFDVDDIILNLLGILLGYFALLPAKRLLLGRR